MYRLILAMSFRKGDVVVEIGSERGDGSTAFLREFCDRIGMPFFSVMFPALRPNTL